MDLVSNRHRAQSRVISDLPVEIRPHIRAALAVGPCRCSMSDSRTLSGQRSVMAMECEQ